MRATRSWPSNYCLPLRFIFFPFRFSTRNRYRCGYIGQVSGHIGGDVPWFLGAKPSWWDKRQTNNRFFVSEAHPIPILATIYACRLFCTNNRPKTMARNLTTKIRQRFPPPRPVPTHIYIYFFLGKHAHSFPFLFLCFFFCEDLCLAWVRGSSREDLAMIREVRGGGIRSSQWDIFLWDRWQIRQ